MTNHTHLLAKMGDVPLSRVLQGLHASYARYFNEKRDVDGHVFQGRPGVKIILDDSYILQLVAYIHKNPVDAGLVTNPGEYRWSSDSYFRSTDADSVPVSCWRFPPHFQGTDRARVYRECLDETIESFKGGDVYVGTEEEWNELERRDESRKHRYPEERGQPSKETIVREVVESTGYKVEDLKKPGRAQPRTNLRQKAMALMYTEGYGPVEIGEFFNRSHGAVNHAVRKFEEND